jgi:hypothetical protein
MNELFNAIAHLCESGSRGLRPYLPLVALAITATLFALYGDGINKYVKDLVKDYHFLLRLLIFVLLVAFGYGALSLVIAHFLAQVMGMLNNLLLLPLTVLIFVLIGFLAEEKNQI